MLARPWSVLFCFVMATLPREGTTDTLREEMLEDNGAYRELAVWVLSVILCFVGWVTAGTSGQQDQLSYFSPGVLMAQIVGGASAAMRNCVSIALRCAPQRRTRHTRGKAPAAERIGSKGGSGRYPRGIKDMPVGRGCTHGDTGRRAAAARWIGGRRWKRKRKRWKRLSFRHKSGTWSTESYEKKKHFSCFKRYWDARWIGGRRHGAEGKRNQRRRRRQRRRTESGWKDAEVELGEHDKWGWRDSSSSSSSSAEEDEEEEKSDAVQAAYSADIYI